MVRSLYGKCIQDIQIEGEVYCCGYVAEIFQLLLAYWTEAPFDI